MRLAALVHFDPQGFLMSYGRRIWAGYVSTFFADPARPVEWLSLLALAGWTQFLVETPELLWRDSYTAFTWLPAGGWAAIMTVVIALQLLAMLPAVKNRETLRFVAMAFAAGLWTVIAINFWKGDAVTTGARTYTALALITALTGVYLGWASRRF